ncbi:MAG: hypothetical protein AABY22_11055, partial [Nanoarchaeota archaeon]
MAIQKVIRGSGDGSEDGDYGSGEYGTEDGEYGSEDGEYGSEDGEYGSGEYGSGYGYGSGDGDGEYRDFLYQFLMDQTKSLPDGNYAFWWSDWNG